MLLVHAGAQQQLSGPGPGCPQVCVAQVCLSWGVVFPGLCRSLQPQGGMLILRTHRLMQREASPSQLARKGRKGQSLGL